MVKEPEQTSRRVTMETTMECEKMQLTPPRTKRDRGVITPTGESPEKQMPRRLTPRRYTKRHCAPDAPLKAPNSSVYLDLSAVRKKLDFENCFD